MLEPSVKRHISYVELITHLRRFSIINHYVNIIVILFF